MKVIAEPKHVRCDYCGSLLEYEVEDVRMDKKNRTYVVCPTCANKVEVEEQSLFNVVTTKNVDFPKDFYHFGGDGAKKLSKKEIKEMIREVVETLSDRKESEYFFMATGDTLVMSYKQEEDEKDIYNIIVCNDYYELEDIKVEKGE